MVIINPEIERYAINHTTEEPELLKQLIKTTKAELEYSDMLSGRLVGRLLQLLVRISGARRVLEIGTFTGYSALMMADALPENGNLITCEVNGRYEKIARRFFKESEHGYKIELIMGEALETISNLQSRFDFCFIDADKVNYPRYYDEVMPRLSDGGLLVIDNIFWGGDVLDTEDEKSRAIDRLNKKIRNDQKVEQVILTVRDGLTIARKIK